MSSKDHHEVEVKRKRSLKKESSPTRGAGDVKRSKSSTNDVKLFYAEEEEVEHRDPKKDLSLFKSTTDDVRKCFKDIRDSKDKPDKSTNDHIETKKRETALHFVLLKKLNRLSHIRCKKSRDATNEAKQRIDQYHLQLQNLLYETMHLEKEITKCLEFKSKDEEIELVSVEEFYEEAPSDISKPETTKEDQHQLRLARLDWELEQRKMLAQKLKESETSKDQLDKEIKTQQEYLENLQPKLTSILQSTKPVQEYLGMPFDQIREQHQIAGHLPHPLYVLYMQTDAYRQACDKKLEVKIEGDIEAAKSMKSTPELFADVEDSDSDQEEQEKKSSKRRRKTIDSGKVERKKKVLKKHPLSVVLKIKTKDGTCLQLNFYYLVTLEIVTVVMQLKSGSESPPSCISGGDLLSPDLLLNEIYPGDNGNTSPNAANQYELRRLGLGEFNQYIKETGKPYLWAQWLSGLQFLNNNKSSKVADSSVSSENMQQTIKRLRRRIKSRLSLLKQLASLERGIIPLAPEAMSLFPTKIVAKLASWKRSTYEDFCVLPYTEELISNGLAKESDIFFTATMDRGSAKMTAQIVMTPDYPAVAPLFLVSLQWQTERSALNDINIQEMEEEVNVHYKEMIIHKSHDQILANQLQRLLMCFDVYLETETQNAEEGPKEISKEKVYARFARGPNRTKPYKFCAEVGIFSHR
ncbi:THO complex subunit 5 homolog isoform X2 [Mytilus edulis]